MTSTAAKRGSGCLKCGEGGHWARDCPAPPEKWLKNRSGEDRLEAGKYDLANGQTREQTPEEERVAVGAAAAAKERRKRPKVTFDLLKQSSGLPEVYHNFPALFQRTFKGRGHELSDLRRLLELYKRWQDRIFPFVEFDQFVASIEKLSFSSIVKKELQDMRIDLLQRVESKAYPENNQMNANVELEASALYGHDEDEELLRLATEGNAAENENRGVYTDLDMDDEDLLELAFAGGDDDPLLPPITTQESVPPTNMARDNNVPTTASQEDQELVELAAQDI